MFLKGAGIETENVTEILTFQLQGTRLLIDELINRVHKTRMKSDN